MRSNIPIERLKDLVYVVLVIVVVTLLFFLVSIFPLAYHFEYVVTILAVLITVMLYSIFVFKFLKKNPTTLSIALLGFPASGKTVFLTVLFDELSVKKFKDITFSPYGSETVERISEDLNLLLSRRWLPATPATGVFYYRAKAIFGHGMFKKNFKIEIGDYAGERIKEFDAGDEKWLHKTDYFKLVIQSDAILIAIDTEKLIEGHDNEIAEMENSLIAAFHILLEGKGVDIGRKLEAPVALLFMKCDLLDRYDKKVVENNLPRLIQVCGRSCSNFETFMVSSVGNLDDVGNPPSKLDPFGLSDPIIWILKHV